MRMQTTDASRGGLGGPRKPRGGPEKNFCALRALVLAPPWEKSLIRPWLLVQGLFFFVKKNCERHALYVSNQHFYSFAEAPCGLIMYYTTIVHKLTEPENFYYV